MKRTRLNINDKPWTIDEVTQRTMDKYDTNAWGLCYPTSRQIIIVKDMSLDEKGAIVAHELAHAVSHEFKIPYKSDAEEEYLIGSMQEVMYRVAQVFPGVYK